MPLAPMALTDSPVPMAPQVLTVHPALTEHPDPRAPRAPVFNPPS